MCPLLEAYCALIPSDAHFTTSFSESFERQRELVRAVEKEAESLDSLRNPHVFTRTQQRARMAANLFLNVVFVSGNIWQIMQVKDLQAHMMSSRSDMLDPEYLEFWVRKIDQIVHDAMIAHVTFKLGTREEQRGPRQLADAQREKARLVLLAVRSGVVATQAYGREPTCANARKIGEAFFEVCYTHGSPDFAVEQGKRLLEVKLDHE
jgi:hypothetical protein